MFPGTTRRQFILTGLTTLLTSTLLNPVSYACSPSPMKTHPRSTRKPRVMIDPGHGGKDPGAIGYIRNDRPERLPYLNGHTALPPENVHQLPLFCTKRGHLLTPDYFRRYRWTPVLAAAGINIRPHQVRHWFVTMALNEIHRSANSEADLLQKRNALQVLMGWRSDMLPAYDQARQRHDLPLLASTIHAYIENKQAEASLITDFPDNRESQGSLMLKEMFGEEP